MKTEIEIYVRGCALEPLLAFVRSLVGPLREPHDAGAALIYATASGSVTVTPSIEDGPFMGVCISPPPANCASDVDCARMAARELGCVVRCDPGLEFPQVPEWSDTFLEIEGAQERLVEWT